ncbi:glutathione S-transferase [Herbaspirillum sp. CF444]|uniref:glutathione S-transferase family protein n=1 Tax=Herbaspirillum sp. CF444 TaxID=1144319 RepID=UPI000272847D|nr:glutathione S-transferase family protein [Herbaspirillum sp. CF444]EJL81586.1 glutathione S-transferase [Herbaspirillum sp. CF444]
MLEVHAFATPNSLKAVIALEELGLDYELVAVNLRQGAQKTEAFKALNPNAKVPVLVDRSAAGELVMAESAAILVHLAEQAGKLLPQDASARAKVFEQLFFHASGVSPAFLEAFLVSIQSGATPEAKAKATQELERVLGVLDQHLDQHAFVAGTDYSIADIAHFGWIWRHQAMKVSLDKFPAVARWYAHVAARPAVVAAIAKTIELAK